MSNIASLTRHISYNWRGSASNWLQVALFSITKRQIISFCRQFFNLIGQLHIWNSLNRVKKLVHISFIECRMILNRYLLIHFDFLHVGDLFLKLFYSRTVVILIFFWFHANFRYTASKDFHFALHGALIVDASINSLSFNIYQAAQVVRKRSLLWSFLRLEIINRRTIPVNERVLFWRYNLGD